jgi:micrococcal nuclease
MRRRTGGAAVALTLVLGLLVALGRVRAPGETVHQASAPLQERGAPPEVPVEPAAAPSRQRAPADSGPRAPVRDTGVCVITRIVDGDTVDCAGTGRVRLIGIDTPERSQRPYGGMATDALRRLARVGDTVALELDVETHDRYDRVLAYLWKDGVLLNWALVRQGWAVTLTYPPNVQYVEALTEAQRQARETGSGLWAIDGFACLPRDHRARRC